MEESQYNEIIKRLERIENLLKPLEEDTSFKKKILSNVIGNLVWEWIYYGSNTLGLGDIHPPKY